MSNATDNLDKDFGDVTFDELLNELKNIHNLGNNAVITGGRLVVYEVAKPDNGEVIPKGMARVRPLESWNLDLTKFPLFESRSAMDNLKHFLLINNRIDESGAIFFELDIKSDTLNDTLRTTPDVFLVIVMSAKMKRPETSEVEKIAFALLGLEFLEQTKKEFNKN